MTHAIRNYGRQAAALLTLALLALAGPAAAQAGPAASAAAPAPSLDSLDAYVEKARAEWNIPGVAVAVVKDDKIIYAKGFGVRELGKPGKVDADTVFAIGSASKAFTGAALAMLVDDKKIQWDGAVHDYMPGFELYDPYATRNATVRDLLSHRTGFISGSGWMWTGSGFDRNEIIRRLRFQKESLGFRNRYAYANEMITAAGEIVPAVTGTSWDDFVKARLFAPLGMTRSFTSITALKALNDVASPHGTVDGKVVPFPYRNIDNVGGAGAINSTVRDLAQWVRLQLGEGVYDGKRLIGQASINETRTGQMVPRGGGGIPPAKFSEYGFGWTVNEFRGRKVVQHGGAVDGMGSIVAFIPEERLGMVVLSNYYPSQLPYALAYKVFDTVMGTGTDDWSGLMRAQFDKLLAGRRAQLRPPATGPASPALPLDRYVGKYTSELLGDATVSIDKGALMFTRPTASAVLMHDRANQFRARWTSLSIRSVFDDTPVGFTLNPAGEVAALDLGTDRFTRAPVPTAPARR